MQQLGIGLAAAVLIDATIIRGVLLPSAMKLLGDRNWWLPERLGWLPRSAWKRRWRPPRPWGTDRSGAGQPRPRATPPHRAA